MGWRLGGVLRLQRQGLSRGKQGEERKDVASEGAEIRHGSSVYRFARRLAGSLK